MSTFTLPELKKYEIGGAAGIVVGFVLALVAHLVYHPDHPLADYVLAFRVLGWVLLIASVVWTALASAHLRSHFFSLDYPMSAQAVGISLAVVIGAAVILLVVVLSQLPTTPVDKLPPEPKLREGIVAVERNFKLFVALFILAAGGIVAFFPIRKSMRN